MKATAECSSCRRPWGRDGNGHVVAPFDQSDVCVDCRRYETREYQASKKYDRDQKNRINGRAW